MLNYLHKHHVPRDLFLSYVLAPPDDDYRERLCEHKARAKSRASTLSQRTDVSDFIKGLQCDRDFDLANLIFFYI